MQIALITFGSILAFLGNIPYLKDVWTGKIQPHPFSWLVWSIVSCVIFFGAVAKGAGLGSVPILVSEFFTILIFLFSLKNGFKHISRTDIFFLLIALLGLVPWYLTSDPTVSVVVAVLIDLTAFAPTIRKTYLHPQSENHILYLMNFSRHVLILFSLNSYNLATTLHSVVMLIVNALMTYLIKIRYMQKINQKLIITACVFLFLAVITLFYTIEFKKNNLDKDSIPTLATTTSTTTTFANTKENLIVVDSPKVYEKISSPLIVKGKARGTWYFEASFPVEIHDLSGKVIGQGNAQAQDNWMTEDFVPYVATITFATDPSITGTTGKIILKKDNQSGLPEKDDSLEIPVGF